MRSWIAAFLIAACSWAGGAEAATILGVSWDGTVSLIDSSNGTGSALGSSGFDGVNALARSPNGQFIAVSRGLLDPAATAFSINPATGAGAALTSLDFGGADDSVRGLAFSNNVLYAVNNGGGRFSTTGLDDLYTINLSTGQAALIGNTGYTGIQALAAGSDGKLYGWDVGTTALDGRGLILIDPATGAATDLDAAVGETSGVDIQTLAFGPDGRLYGGKSELYLIDPATGATSLVGSGGYADVRGFEFLPAANPQPTDQGSGTQNSHRSPVPEPGTLILVGLGLAGAAGRMRSRRAG